MTTLSFPPMNSVSWPLQKENPCNFCATAVTRKFPFLRGYKIIWVSSNQDKWQHPCGSGGRILPQGWELLVCHLHQQAFQDEGLSQENLRRGDHVQPKTRASHTSLSIPMLPDRCGRKDDQAGYIGEGFDWVAASWRPLSWANWPLRWWIQLRDSVDQTHPTWRKHSTQG